MTSPLWIRGDSLKELPTEQPFYAWYAAEVLPDGADLDLTRSIPDRILRETHRRVAASTPQEELGMVRVYCVTDPDYRYRREEITDLMPTSIVLTYTGGVYKAEGEEAGEAPEIPERKAIYRLHALRLMDVGQGYEQVVAQLEA